MENIKTATARVPSCPRFTGAANERTAILSMSANAETTMTAARKECLCSKSSDTSAQEVVVDDATKENYQMNT